MTEWFADESFWKTFYPYLFPEDRFEVAEEQVEKILILTQFKGDSILDLACGPGRHSVILAKKGFRVTGVDLSPFLLSRAEKLAECADVQIEWILKDMRHFSRPNTFEMCLSMFTSFGYFEDKKDDHTILSNIYESLTKGGVVIIDVSGKEWLAKHFQPTASHELADGSLLIERREILEDWSRIRNTWIILRDGRAQDYSFEHTIYSAQELKNLLADAGFESVDIYGDLDGAEYGIGASRLVAIAKKH
jgi:SAM-dependent methyltransferase